MFISIITDDDCQYWKNLDEMILTSPNYPKLYNADGVRCEWLISAQEGFIIALEFNHFDVSNLIKRSNAITVKSPLQVETLIEAKFK